MKVATRTQSDEHATYLTNWLHGALSLPFYRGMVSCRPAPKATWQDTATGSPEWPGLHFLPGQERRMLPASRHHKGASLLINQAAMPDLVPKRKSRSDKGQQGDDNSDDGDGG